MPFQYTESNFLKDLTILMIHSDFDLAEFSEGIVKLADPKVSRVHICMAKRIGFRNRRKIVSVIRKTFPQATYDFRNVEDHTIKICAFFVQNYLQ